MGDEGTFLMPVVYEMGRCRVSTYRLTDGFGFVLGIQQ